MDYENLISEVYVRRTLWDVNDKDYHNRIVLDSLWKEVEEILGFSVIECKKKWKYMRDRFRLELKKIEATETKSSWCYFDQMLFVKFQMGVYKGRRVLPEDGGDSSSAVQIENNEAQFSDLETTVDYNETSNDDLQLVQPPTSKKRKRHEDNKDPFLALEDRVAAILAKNIDERESDDLLFFKSLLGFMKDFSPLRRLRVRGKIQNVIMEELNTSNEVF